MIDRVELLADYALFGLFMVLSIGLIVLAAVAW